jgi:4-hydroxybenzoate polyprenyltransferase
MVDRDDDVKIGMRTSAIFFGRFDVAAVMASELIFVAIMAATGAWQGFGPLYYAGLAAALALALAQYPMIQARSREGCFRAFRFNNWVGCAVFVGILFDRTDWKYMTAWWPA